jgi:hypothetical protein
LHKYITEVRNTTPIEILNSEYNFFYSLDSFLFGLLSSTNSLGLVIGNDEVTKYVANIAVAHDCVEKVFDIITNDFIFITRAL